MKIGIVGYGHVGKAMGELFKDAVIYDEPLHIGTREEINKCDAVFVCTPTPQNPDGSCNTEIVESVIDWLNVDIIILRSTVYVGFTKAMVAKYKKAIVFQPEYYGETVAHPFSDLRSRQWVSLGGTKENIQKAVKVYQTVYTSNVEMHFADSDTVELAKYMENAYLAAKVIFCNEMYDLANKLGINYDEAREIWLADPRIGRSHTFVYEDNRGYGGSCLPKDVASILYQAKQLNIDMTLLKAVVEKNNKLKKQ